MIFLLLASLVVYFFIVHIIRADKGTREPRNALLQASLYGILAIFLAGILNEIFVPNELSELIKNPETIVPDSTLILGVIMIGIVEESVKAIPLAFFIYKKRYFNEFTDGILYFGIVGLTFGIIEDLVYMAEFGTGTGIIRILTAPYLHASFTALFGVFLARKKLLKQSWLVVVGGLLAAAAVHALYDYTAFKGGAALFGTLGISLAMNILLFIMYRKAQKQDEEHGMSAVGINKFCRNCGRPNARQMLFCERCGKKT